MKKINADVQPARNMTLLSKREVDVITQADARVMKLFRRCALAVLNTGADEDDETLLIRQYHDFNVEIVPQSRGVMLRLTNAPAAAFVNGHIILGVREHLFAVLRDVVFANHKLSNDADFDLATSEGLTDSVFRILRNADVVNAGVEPNLVVCWGGHSIGRTEYLYTKEVGYSLGLRKLDIVTGCGPGAMKGPMKGAVIGHGKQHHKQGRYLGVSEPGIIAAEAPNPTVNELVILPDIEKRLEAFVRLAHAIVVFPGGPGTAEEVLYLLGVKMAAGNEAIPLPLIFAAPEESASYFDMLDEFIRQTLGESATKHYQIIIGQPEKVADVVAEGIQAVKDERLASKESFVFNWRLNIPKAMQLPFQPTHANMAALNLSKQCSPEALAVQLRRAFSGIVAGNVKAPWVEAVKQHGPYQLQCDPAIATALGDLLEKFVAKGRMKIHGNYKPCFSVS